MVITGLGVISPVGNSKEESWVSLCEGKNGIGRITKFDASGFTSQLAGEVKDFDASRFISPKGQRRMDKFVQFAVSAAKMALEDSGIELERENKARIGVITGSGIGGLKVIEDQHKILLERGPSRVSPFLIPMLIADMAPGQISILLGLTGPNLSISTACASASHALGDALMALQQGRADVMLSGGTEACITPLGLGGFCSAKALSTRNDDPEHASRPFDLERDGFIMAEGAGILVLETLEHATARGAQVYCEIAGCGMTSDAYHMTAPDPEGKGATECIRLALEDARVSPQDVDYINAHGTSTEYNDKIESLSIKKVFGEYAKTVAISSTKSMTGHLLGAAGGVEAAVCALAIKNGIIPPTTNYQTPDPECDLDYVPNEARERKVRVALSNSFGFGGHNAALVFKKI